MESTQFSKDKKNVFMKTSNDVQMWVLYIDKGGWYTGIITQADSFTGYVLIRVIFTGSSLLWYPSRDQLLLQCRHTTIKILILSHIY